jgi:hypothetical protein
MKIDNAKRMDLVKGILKPKKSSGSVAGSRSSKSSSSRPFKSRSVSRTSSSSSSHCISTDASSSSTDTGVFSYKLTVKIENSWDEVKNVDNYKDTLGEALLVKMIQIEPASRKHMNFPSMRSERFDVLTEAIVSTIDSLVALVGPELDMTDLDDFAGQLRAENVDPILVSKALLDGLERVTPLTKETHDAWEEVMLPVLRMLV